ncbi:hypothetical protein BH10PSE19_BH10PSE19_11500 [soil metagenome]
MRTLKSVKTLLSLITGLLMLFCVTSYAADTTKVNAKKEVLKPNTSEIEIINDYSDHLDVKVTRDHQLTLGQIKHAPAISTRILSKQKSIPLDIGNVANSYFTLSVKSKDGKWRDFTCVLEFPNIAPYKTEVMCESDVGGDMYISAAGHQIHVHYVTPNEDAAPAAAESK